MRIVILFLYAVVYADSAQDFDKAYQYGKQHQFNLNLNKNSSIDEYAKDNHVYSKNYVDPANAGKTASKNIYDNTYGDRADPNYLYNEGVRAVQDCQKKQDGVCTTFNKYGDRDTQSQYQAYSKGYSQKYYINVKPDPSDSSCSNVIRKVPVNPIAISCEVGNHYQTKCNAIISVSASTSECAANDCEKYRKNPDCNLIKEEVPWKCTYHYSVDMCAGGNFSGDWVCETTPTSTPPAITKSDGYASGVCGAGYLQNIQGWGGCPYGRAKETNKSCTNTQPAIYLCKTYGYSGCSL